MWGMQSCMCGGHVAAAALEGERAPQPRQLTLCHVDIGQLPQMVQLRELVGWKVNDDLWAGE